MSGMAHFFVVVGGSKFHERLAHFFIDIYNTCLSIETVLIRILFACFLRTTFKKGRVHSAPGLFCRVKIRKNGQFAIERQKKQ